MQTVRYRQQHDTLRSLIAAFPNSAAAVSEDIVRSLIAKFIGLLRAHLTMEDTYLYPVMLQHEDNAVREKAQRFQHEMGSLAKSVEAFYAKWSRAGAITANPAGFVQEWTQIRSVLSNRMNREDSDLYELVDRTLTLRRSA